MIYIFILAALITGFIIGYLIGKNKGYKKFTEMLSDIIVNPKVVKEYHKDEVTYKITT